MCRDWEPRAKVRSRHWNFDLHDWDVCWSEWFQMHHQIFYHNPNRVWKANFIYPLTLPQIKVQVYFLFKQLPHPPVLFLIKTLNWAKEKKLHLCVLTNTWLILDVHDSINIFNGLILRNTEKNLLSKNMELCIMAPLQVGKWLFPPTFHNKDTWRRRETSWSKCIPRWPMMELTTSQLAPTN